MQELSVHSWTHSNSASSSRNCSEIFFDRVCKKREDSEPLKSEKKLHFLRFLFCHWSSFPSPSSRSTAVWSRLFYLDLFGLCLFNLSCLLYLPFLCCQLLRLTCVPPILPDFFVYFPIDAFSPRLLNLACFPGLCFSKYLSPRISLA